MSTRGSSPTIVMGLLTSSAGSSSAALRYGNSARPARVPGAPCWRSLAGHEDLIHVARGPHRSVEARGDAARERGSPAHPVRVRQPAAREGNAVIGTRDWSGHNATLQSWNRTEARRRREAIRGRADSASNRRPYTGDAVRCGTRPAGVRERPPDRLRGEARAEAHKSWCQGQEIPIQLLRFREPRSRQEPGGMVACNPGRVATLGSACSTHAPIIARRPDSETGAPRRLPRPTAFSLHSNRSSSGSH